jgi:multimeric flavodoxin WrbA
MKILGISGSPRKKDVSGTHKLVSTVLEASGCEYELVSLEKNADIRLYCLFRMCQRQCMQG